MASKKQTRACSRCGLSEDCAAGGLPPGWTFTVEGARVEYLCVPCARRNLRAIEGKLPEEYWD
jgi:hypothetical protein